MRLAREESIARALAALAMTVGACGGDPEATSIERAVAGPAPDYIVAVLADPPAAARNGTSFALSTTVRNIGDAAAAAASTTRYFLSSDAVVGSDRSFAQSATVPPLGAGASDTQTVVLALPASTPSGSYFVIACADRGATVPESDNRNNCRPSAGTVAVTGPDLVVESLADPPPFRLPGETFSASDAVRNRGTAPSGASVIGYFLSASPVRGPQAVPLVRRRRVEPLEVGAVGAGSVAVTVPALAPGSYFLLACADVQAIVPESDERNNCTAAAGLLTIPIADLTVSALTSPPPLVEAGDGFVLTDTTENRGNLAAPSSTTGFALSADDAPGGDIPLRGQRTAPALAAGGAATGTTQLVVDRETPPGSYVVLACADSPGAIAEGSEVDNCRASAGRVTVAEPAPARVVLHLLGHIEEGDPAPGAPVLVHGPDGALLARTATDAAGIAEATVPVGGSVTVVETDTRHVTTFRGVKTGDELLVGDFWRAQFLGTVTLVVPSSGPPGTVAYDVYSTPCAMGTSESPEVTVFLYDGCASTRRPILLAFYDADGAVIGSIFDPDVLLEPNTSITLSGEISPPVDFSVSLSGIPEDVPRIELAMGRLFGPHIARKWNEEFMAVTDREVRGSQVRAVGGDGLVTELRMQDMQTGAMRRILEFRRTTASSLEGNVADDFVAMPGFESILYDEIAPGATEVVGLGFTMNDGPGIDGIVMGFEKRDQTTGRNFSWILLAPPPPTGPGELRFPRLPADLAWVWIGGDGEATHLQAVDTPAASYREFVRDARPQLRWAWQWWEPSPGKVRTSGTF